MIRWAIAAAALGSAMPVSAGTGVAVESAVFVEHAGEQGLRVEPAQRFTTGDRVVTVMTWQAPSHADYVIVSAVPRRLELESVSRTGLEFSTDGGRTWSRVANARELPRGVTHLRWPADGDGRLTYRAVVR